MAIYRVQAPDGGIIRIEGPDDATQEQLAQAVSAYAQAAQAPATTPEMAPVLEQIKDAFTGNLRKTAETEALPDWATMPELNQMSVESAKTGLGTVLANPSETAQIIQANFPDAQVRQDEKGNFIIRSSVDGQEYAIKPGFRVSDIPRALTALAAFTPAGRAATLPGAAVAGGATQAIIEGTQAATGGEFNPADVAVAAAVPPVVMGTLNAARAAATPLRAAAQRIFGGAPEAVPVQAGAQQAAAVPPAPVSTPVQPMPAAELAQTARKAAEGGLGSAKATQVLAKQAAPDPKVMEAAKRLGIDEFLQPDHVTTNQAYRELAQAVKSVPGSEARAAELQGLEQVAKRADDLIEEIGGTTDLSMLDSSVKSRLMTTQRDLEEEANTLYSQLRRAVPARTQAPANKVLEFIEQRAADLGAKQNLSPMEKQILGKLSPKNGTQPTYTLLDDVRKDLGSAARAAGPFKDADTGLSKKLYSLLSDDQAATVSRLGMSDTYNAARSAVAVRKGLEDDLAALFGKNLDQSLVGDLSGAVRALPGGDASKFIRLVKAIPEEMRRDVVASGLNAAFGKTAKNGSLNFKSYASWYEGLLRNKQSYTALMANLPPQSRKQLSDLYRVSKGISSATKERITTGRINAVKDELKDVDGLISSLYSLAKRSAVAVPAEAAASAAGVPGAGISAALASALTKGKTPAIKAADALIASDEFIAAAKQAGTQGEKAARLRLVHSQPFSRYVRAVGQPRELSDREKWVLQAMQAQNQQQR